MASRSVHIADYSRALVDGTFPGAFNADRTVYEFPTVESINSRGARLIWVIRVRLLSSEGIPLPFDEDLLTTGAEAPEGTIGEITTESHQISAKGVVGKTRAGGKPTIVRIGKNIGKVNATNVATQALRDALGRYNAQLKRAHVIATPLTPEARASQPPPMLVKRIGETREATLTPEDFAKGITVQRKFNGVRAPAYLRGDSVQVYSRTKRAYPGFAHIRKDLECPLKTPPEVPVELLRPLPDCGEPEPDAEELARLKGLYAEAHVHLDGEIYKHGKSLRWISGQARREEDEETLDYVVYDCFFPGPKAAGHDMSSANRQKYLDLFFATGCALTHIKRAENFRATSLEEAEALRDRFLDEGYEGAIARKDCTGYRYSVNNYHSANLVKLKPKFDSEFEVVGYTQGTKGKDVGAVIWICEVDPDNVKDPADKIFNVVPKDMTYEERYRIYRCLGELVENDRPDTPTELVTRFTRDFLGRPLTVEYPERSTKTGKPTQAKALIFRTYEGGPALDPVRRLYAECDAE